jgi:hypothetical protein
MNLSRKIAIPALTSLFIASGALAVTITQQPTSVNAAYPTQAITLEVVANGDASLSYQWRKDGLTVAGATTSALVIHDMRVDKTGRFDCVVTDGAGSQTSRSAWVHLKGKPSVWDLKTGMTEDFSSLPEAVYLGWASRRVIYLLENGQVGYQPPPNTGSTSGSGVVVVQPIAEAEPPAPPTVVTDVGAGVVKLFANISTAAALRSNGEVVYWGSGNFTHVPAS